MKSKLLLLFLCQIYINILSMDFCVNDQMVYFASLPKDILAVYYPMPNEEVIKNNIDKGMDINLKSDIDGKTILMHAVLRDNEKVVQLLLEHGANVNLKDKKGCTALIYASTLESSEITQRLIDAKVKLNLKNKKGETALMYCLRGRNHCYENFKCLIEAGADVNKQDKKGHSALMMIFRQFWSYRNLSRFARLLIEQPNTDFNLQDDQGYTALMHCSLSYCEMFKDLLKNESIACNLDLQDNEGMTILMHTINIHYPDNILAIIDKGVNLHLQNNKGEIALAMAERRSNLSGIVSRLKDEMGIPRGITSWIKQLIGLKPNNNATADMEGSDNALDLDNIA